MGAWLMSVEELAGCYRDIHVVVVDCRFSLSDTGLGAEKYATDHIPGSGYLHLDRDLSGAKQAHGGRHPLPDVERFAQTLRALGVNSDTLVVAYDDSRFAFAARAWWLLRYCGHDNVRVLDGGYNAWVSAGLPVATDVPVNVRGNFVAQLRPEMVVDRERVIELRGNAGHRLVDSRETPRFLGLEEPIDPHAGHIEGALNYPWQQVADEHGGFAAADVQRARWQEIADAENIVVYCGSGVTACVNLLSLASIGRSDAQLYAGSWSDWCSYY